jgi:hypothetical protein
VEEAMNSKVLFAAVFAALVAAFGCVATPTAVDSPTAYAPPTEPSGDGVIEGMARGNLPDGCTTINEVIQERDGNTFRVTITTVRPVGMVCTEALVPFEKVIVLDVYGLPAGVYTVDVNGVGDTFELTVDNMPAESPAEPTAVSTALPTAPPALGSIGGLVWHDLCKVPYETVAVPPEGCVMLPGG